MGWRADGTLGRVVQIGAASGLTATIPASLLRRHMLSMLGYDNLLVPRDVKRAVYRRMIGHVAAVELTARTAQVPLGAAGEAWTRQQSSHGFKLVLVSDLDCHEAPFESLHLAGTSVA